jgi:hypothetical protein
VFDLIILTRSYLTKENKMRYVDKSIAWVEPNSTKNMGKHLYSTDFNYTDHGSGILILTAYRMPIREESTKADISAPQRRSTTLQSLRVPSILYNFSLQFFWFFSQVSSYHHRLLLYFVVCLFVGGIDSTPRLMSVIPGRHFILARKTVVRSQHVGDSL